MIVRTLSSVPQRYKLAKSGFQDAEGSVRILALDHETSFQSALRRFAGPGVEMSTSEIIQLKLAILESATANVTGAIVDVNLLPYANSYNVPLLLKIESGWEPSPSVPSERLTRVHEGAMSSLESQVMGIKLALYFDPDATSGTQRYQKSIAQRVGEFCFRNDLVFVLEPLSYATFGGTPIEYDLRRPYTVLASAYEFSQPSYHVDILKLDFPCDLRLIKEYSNFFPDAERFYFQRETLHHWCQAISSASSCPWTIMSSGARQEVFLECLRIASASGAAGYMCGQNLWQDALKAYPDVDEAIKRAQHLTSVNLKELNQLLGCGL